MTIRSFRPGDRDEVVTLWHRCKRAAYTYLPLEQARTLAEDHGFFTSSIEARCSVWVYEDEGGIAGFLAIAGDYIGRLYIHVDRQRSGIGTALLDHARTLSPERLELHTHVKNSPACAFYENHGFEAVEFGVSPPPESEPDVRYVWPRDA